VFRINSGTVTIRGVTNGSGTAVVDGGPRER